MFNLLKRILGRGTTDNPYELPMERRGGEDVVPGAAGSGAKASMPDSPEAQIARAIASKNLILAIKLVRQHTGVGLAEAKGAVERGTWRELLR